MTFSEAIHQGQAILESSQASFGDANDHMVQITEVALAMSRAQIFQRLNDPLPNDGFEKIKDVLKRRIAGEPLQYISGVAGFWNDNFQVGVGVLIPRPETELLVELLVQKSNLLSQTVAELGAGSGNIGLSVLGERPAWKWWAYEKNPESLAFAKKNHQSILMGTPNYRLVGGDFFETAAEFAPYDWIVTNPPYISSAEIASLSKEVNQEPRLALDGGQDGLDVIRRLAKMQPLLSNSGNILMEIAEDQGQAVCDILSQQGFQGIELHKDRAGLDRAVLAKRGPNGCITD